MHKPITIQDLSIQFKQKICFTHLNQQIHAGERIAIIGNNGAGKTSLLKALYGIFTDYDGSIQVVDDVDFAYIEQIPATNHCLSGGELFKQHFYSALESLPNCLLLDEPTNHLDEKNRQELFEHIRYFYGTVITVTHDVDFMQACFDVIWHIDQGEIKVFRGKYNDYAQERLQKKLFLDKKMQQLVKDKKAMHQKLMQEQHRAATSSAKGAKSIQNKKWATVVSHAKARRAQETTGRKKQILQENKQAISDELNQLNMPIEITPTFHMPSHKTSGVIMQIADGVVSYEADEILTNVHLQINAEDKVILEGNNGSGKTTLLKAIMQDDSVTRMGDWIDINSGDIGYLDQHYKQLPESETVLSAMQLVVPDWDTTQIYRHLADFLFKGDTQVNIAIKHLSGGEKARLSLALIAAKPPKLLILDEITNNVDLQTIDYLTQILSAYPGALLLISHNKNFVNQLPITKGYVLTQGKVLENNVGDE